MLLCRFDCWIVAEGTITDLRAQVLEHRAAAWLTGCRDPVCAQSQVTGVSGTEVYCTANNDATLGGLLTVFHTERSSDSLTNVQNSLPVILFTLRIPSACASASSLLCVPAAGCVIHRDWAATSTWKLIILAISAPR